MYILQNCLEKRHLPLHSKRREPNMQSDLESGIPSVQSLKEQEPVNDKKSSLPLKSLLAGQYGLRGRQRLSSTAWYLILVLGDVFLLVALLGLLLFFHRLPQMSTIIFGIRELELIWICP